MKKFINWCTSPTNMVPIYLVMMFILVIPIFFYFLFKKDKRQQMWNKFKED